MSESTPPDHIVISLKIDVGLLPEWFAEVRQLAVGRVRRMAVIEKPDQWIVQCEIHRDKADEFKSALATAWTAFQSPDDLPEG